MSNTLSCTHKQQLYIFPAISCHVSTRYERFLTLEGLHFQNYLEGPEEFIFDP